MTALGLLVGCATAEPPGTSTPGSTGGKTGSGGSTPSNATGGSSGSNAGSGGSSGTGGGTGGAEPNTGGSSAGGSGGGGTASGGSSGTNGGTGGSSEADASAPGTGGGGGVATDGGSTTGPDPTPPDGIPTDYGGVGELKLNPLVYTAQPVPPIVTMDCPEDPTAGFAEYKDSFVVQRPVNLAAKDRFKYEGGIYTTWIFPGDKSHNGNATKPRTETRFSDLNSGEHIMSFDVKVEAGVNGTVIHQYKSAGTKGGNIGLYVEMAGGTMKDRAGTVATGVAGKWVNLKSYFNVESGVGKIWLNNCLKVTSQKEKNAEWYFKFGNYHCDGSPKCEASFKNIHFYQKNSTDKYNVMSKTP
jgi:hypothetical protein